MWTNLWIANEPPPCPEVGLAGIQPGGCGVALRRPIDTGEPDADRRATFEEIWADRDALQSYCNRIFGDPALAEDMVQEAYAEVWAKLDHFERRASFLPLLATVAKRRGLNELRRNRRATPVGVVPEFVAGEGSADPADVVVARDEAQRLQDAVALLTPRQQRLLLRAMRGDLSRQQLAMMEGSTPGSVRSSLMRTRAKLRVAIEDGMAWVCAPISSVAHWAKRRLDRAALRSVEATPVTTAAFEKLGEAVAAVVVATAVVGGGGGAPPVVRVLGASAVSPAGAVSAEPTGAAVQATSGARLGVRASRGADVAAATPVATSASLATTPAPAGPPGDAPAPAVPNPIPTQTPVTTPPPPASPVNEPDAVENPEDAQFSHFAVTEGSSPEIFALGTSAGTCQGDCTVLFHSSDDGTTWKKLRADGLTGATQILPARGYPQDNRLYAMTPTGLRLSRDRGASFAAVDEAPYSAEAAMSPEFSRGDERILIGSQPPWTYDAKGDRSTPFTSAPMPAAQNFFAFDPGFASSRLLFAATSVNGPSVAKRAVVYRCIGDECDAGTEVKGMRSSPRLHVSSLFPDDQTVFAWDEDDLARSTDGGASFEGIDLPTPGVVKDLADDGNGNLYAAVFDYRTHSGGVIRSSNGGETWMLRGGGTALAQGTQAVATTPTGHVLAAPTSDQNSGLLCSPDQGENWFPRCPPL